MKRSRKSGFTLVEVIVVGILMTFLVAILLPLAWEATAHHCVATMIRCQIGQEAQLVAMSLAADCGGHLPGKREDITGGKADGFRCPQATVSDEGTQLIITYSDATTSDATTVVYALDTDEHTLLRTQGAASVVVAANVYDMYLVDGEEDDEEPDDRIKVKLTFSFRDWEDSSIPDKYRHPYQYVFYVPKGVAP